MKQKKNYPKYYVGLDREPIYRFGDCSHNHFTNNTVNIEIHGCKIALECDVNNPIFTLDIDKRDEEISREVWNMIHDISTDYGFYFRGLNGANDIDEILGCDYLDVRKEYEKYLEKKNTPVELTVEEVSNLLGYKVKIVSESDKKVKEE